MANTITLNIFAKVKNVAGKPPFTVYFTTLKEGEPAVRVKFRQECEILKNTPAVIEVEKGKCNLVSETYIDKDGATAQSKTLWISAYKYVGEYVDHSMDEYFN